MKILLSAFACGPNQGSEPGLGWRWSVEAARQGHAVTVLTQREHQAAIEAEIASQRLPKNLDFIFFMPLWLDRCQRAGVAAGYASITHHLSHLSWQILAYRFVRQHVDLTNFDCLHHLTYSGLRHPTLMGRLPVPLVLGPLGGGERAPYALRQSLPFGGWLKDAIRDLHTGLIRFDPITRRACADAFALYVKTAQSRDALPTAARRKARIMMEIGTEEITDVAIKVRRRQQPLRLLFAGRFIYWKGMDLGLKALAQARSRGLDARLTMLGTGPDEARWRRLARALGIAADVTWLAWADHRQMGAIYRDHDVLLFPSLHDSSGNVVVEALAHGLPVVCLDLGGPAVLVDRHCGRVIATATHHEQRCLRDLADAMIELGAPDGPLADLSKGALEHARAMRWPVLVGGFYQELAERLADRRQRLSDQPFGGDIEHEVEQKIEEDERQRHATMRGERRARNEPVIE